MLPVVSDGSASSKTSAAKLGPKLRNTSIPWRTGKCFSTLNSATKATHCKCQVWCRLPVMLGQLSSLGPQLLHLQIASSTDISS